MYELVDDLPVGVWVARVPNGELIYANRRFTEIMGQIGRDDVTVGGYSEPYGILTRDGKPYPERRMPFVRAVEERQVVVVDDITIRRPDRAHVHIRAYANPVMDAAGVISRSCSSTSRARSTRSSRARRPIVACTRPSASRRSARLWVASRTTSTT